MDFSKYIRKLTTTVKRPRRGTTHENLLRELTYLCGPLTGLRVLDVGCDRDGALVQRTASNFGASEVVGINLTTTDRQILPNARLLRVDACDTGFPESHFDLIMSFSAFEHIHNFSAALAELHRVLKPGGLLYTRFGPIWSAPYGHHLWADAYTYWNTFLPPWCHLLMKPDELRNFLASNIRLNSHALDTIVNYVFDPSDEYGFSQNKLMFEDYANLINESPFYTVLFKGYNDPNLDSQYLAPITIVEQLNEFYPSYRNFHYTGIFMILKR